MLAQPYENRFLLDRIPDFYERLKGSYDERFYQQEVLGQYLNMDRRPGVHRIRPGDAR